MANVAWGIARYYEYMNYTYLDQSTREFFIAMEEWAVQDWMDFCPQEKANLIVAYAKLGIPCNQLPRLVKLDRIVPENSFSKWERIQTRWALSNVALVQENGPRTSDDLFEIT